MSDLKDGEPTGLLNHDGSMMEVNCYVHDQTGEKHRCGVRWVPITDEIKEKIINGNTQTVSMGAIVSDDMKARMPTEDHLAEVEAKAWNKPDKWPYIEIGKEVMIHDGGVWTAAVKDRVSLINVPPGTNHQRAKECLAAHESLIKGKGLTTTKIPEPGPNYGTADNPLLAEATKQTVEENSVGSKGTIHSPFERGAQSLWSKKINNEVVGFQPDSVSLTTEGVQMCGRGFVNTGTSHLETEITVGPGLTSPDSVVTYDPTPEQRKEIAREYALSIITEFEFRAKAAEHSGHNVNYYSVPVRNPKRPERLPYIFEVEDLIQALRLNFHEGTVLKSLIRSATERELGLVKQGGDSIRDAEKMIHSSQELLRDRKLTRDSK